MNNHAIVMSSQLSKYGRWDVAFHLAVNRTKDQVEKLKERYADAQVIEMLQKLDGTTLSALKPLVRNGSTNRSTNRGDYLRAAVEYPHIALALVQEVAQTNMDRIIGKMAEQKQALEDLRAVMGDEN